MKNYHLSQREENVLLLLKKFDFMSRDQLNGYFKFGTIRNTNRILSNIAPYLNRLRHEYKTVYYLSRQGKAYVDCEKVRKKGMHVQHTIMRNDLWLFNDCPSDWKNEVKVSDGYTSIVMDAMFKDSWGRSHFVEVDHTQSMRENHVKIAKYKDLYKYGAIEEKLGHFPTLVWLTTTENRRKQLKEACEGLPAVMVFTTQDIN